VPATVCLSSPPMETTTNSSPVQVVEDLLSANPKLASRADSDDRLPVHWACSYNHLAIVRLLSESKFFDVDAADGSGWTPLMIACSIKESDALVDFLLGRDADANAKSNGGQTALHFCASKANLPLARKLLEHKASTRTKDRHSQLPLHRAAAVGSTPLVNLLLEHNSPINAQDGSGLTALHHAMAEGHGDTAMALLRKGAASDRLDEEGRLPIQCAPDKKVGSFVLNMAEDEGIDVALPVFAVERG